LPPPDRALLAPNSFAALALEQADRLAGPRIKEASYKVRTLAASRQHLFNETGGGWLRRLITASPVSLPDNP